MLSGVWFEEVLRRSTRINIFWRRKMQRRGSTGMRYGSLGVPCSKTSWFGKWNMLDIWFREILWGLPLIGGAGRGKCIGLLRDDRLGFSRSGKVCLRWSVKLRNTWFKWVRNHLRWKERYRNRRLVRQRQRDYLLRDAGVRQDCLGFARSVNTCLR